MEPSVVHFEGEAVIHLPWAGDATVRIELVGGRDRHSVGGQIAEGPRWWHGSVEWKGQRRAPKVDAGSEVQVQLPNGRVAVAVIERVTPDPAPAAEIRGLGAPPFDVP